MKEESVIILEVSPLSDEAVNSVCEILYNFVSAFENHFAPQLRRHAKKVERDIEETLDLSGKNPF